MSTATLLQTNKAPSKESWLAELELRFSSRAAKTVMAERRQRGPLAIQRPFYPEGDVCHAYVLHPPGGVVGGDRLNITLNVDAHAAALLTTPGATKFYRSAGQQAHQHQHFKVNGSLEWLPQENIFFPGANSRLSTHIHLEADARYIGWEVQCLGRPVIGERFERGSLLLSTQLYRNNKPLFIERLTVQGERDLQGAAGLRNQPVMANLLATPATAEVLGLARSSCEAELMYGVAGATLMNEVLIVRYIGSSTAEAHRLLRTVWQTIRPLINQRTAVTPRIWNT
ncbi:MAG: urease accessory protein UreD [Thiolinea sp.]